jgi:hypothetical protein
VTASSYRFCVVVYKKYDFFINFGLRKKITIGTCLRLPYLDENIFIRALLLAYLVRRHNLLCSA